MANTEWRIKTEDGQYVQCGLFVQLGQIEGAEIFNQDDNPSIKLAFFESILKVKLMVEIV